MLGKVHDVAKVGAAKRVDALGVVADHRDVVMGRRQQTDDLRLQVIGVLVLVDHDEAIDVGQALAHLGVIGQKIAQLGQEIVVVEQRFGSACSPLAALDFGKLEIDVDQMRVLQFEQIVQRGLSC